MSVTLQIPNYPDINIKERSSLDADIAAGVTELTLKNNNNVAAGDPLLIGAEGAETAEIKIVQSASGATAVVTTETALRHARYEAVTALIGSKIRIYRAADVNGTAPADSDFAQYADIDIDADNLTTKYTDPNGSGAFWYKATYFNVQTLAETRLTDSVAAHGTGANNYASIAQIRKEAGFSNSAFISDILVDQFRRQAQATINGRLSGVYTTPFAAPINPLIELITIKLAGGLLLIDQYGVFTTTDTNNGQARIDMANDYLDQLISGKLTLVDPGSGAVTPAASGYGFSGYPNATTEALHPGEGFKFKASDRY